MNSGSDYARVERAIRYLEEHASEQPGLADVARAVGLSEFHFHRLFHRWAGVTPKSFLQFLTAAEAKRLLEQSKSVLESSLSVGLSGPSRLHDLFVTHEAMSPGEWKAGGEGLELRYGFQSSPFGTALVIVAPRGLARP